MTGQLQLPVGIQCRMIHDVRAYVLEADAVALSSAPRHGNPLGGMVHAQIGELAVGITYGPLLFEGVYYVMTGHFSLKLLWLSISFALVAITLLYTDFFLDFNTDKEEGKKTLCTVSGSKHNAYYLYIFIIFLIYANLFLGIHSHIFPVKYGIIFLSFFFALQTIGQLQNYIDKEIKNEKEFMIAMNNVQKFIAIFAVLCIISFF